MTAFLLVACLLALSKQITTETVAHETFYISKKGQSKLGCGRSITKPCSEIGYVISNEPLPPKVEIKFFIDGGEDHQPFEYQHEYISIRPGILSLTLLPLPNSKRPRFINSQQYQTIQMFGFSRAPNLRIEGMDFQYLTPLTFSTKQKTNGSIILRNTTWDIKQTSLQNVVLIDSPWLIDVQMSVILSDIQMRSPNNKDVPIIRDAHLYKNSNWDIQIIRSTFLATGLRILVDGGFLEIKDCNIWGFVDTDYVVKLEGFDNVKLSKLNYNSHPPTAQSGLMLIQHVKTAVEMKEVEFYNINGLMVMLNVNNVTRFDILDCHFKDVGKDMQYVLYFNYVHVLNFNRNTIKYMDNWSHFFTAKKVEYINMFDNRFSDVMTSYTALLEDCSYIDIVNTTFHNVRQPLSFSKSIHIHLTNCTFWQCVSKKGGGLSVNSGLLTIENCNFTYNKADLQAGAIDSENTNVEIFDSLFRGNHATSSGTFRFTGNNDKHILMRNVNITSPGMENLPVFATILENNGPYLTIDGHSNIDILASKGYIDIFTTTVSQNSTFNYFCPKNTNAISNEKKLFECKSCEKDKYSLQSGSLTYDEGNIYSKKMNCIDCPSGAECQGSEMIYSKINYWGYTKGSKVRFILCPEDYCCGNEDKCIGIDSCSNNREGAICGKCRKGYYVNFFSNDCIPKEKCKNEAAFWAIFGVLIVGAFLVISFLPEMGRWSKTCCTKRDDQLEPLIDDQNKVSKSAILFGFIKILINFYQILLLIRIDRTASGESEIDIIREILPTIFNLKITIKHYTESFCPSEHLNDITKLFIYHVFPTIALAALAFVFFCSSKVLKLVCRYCPNNEEEEGRGENQQMIEGEDEDEMMSFDVRCKVFIARMLLITYTSITTYIMLMTKPEYVKDETVLFISGVIPYNNNKTIISIIIFIIWVFAFPPNVYFVTRWLQESKITINQFLVCYCFPPASLVILAQNKFRMTVIQQVDPNTKYLLAIFQTPFRIKESTKMPLLWDPVILFRRFIIALFSVFISNYIIRLSVILPLIFFMCIHHSKISPYKEKLLNMVEIVCFYILSFLTAINLFWAFFYIFNLPYQQPVSILGDILKVVEFFLTILPFFIMVIYCLHGLFKTCYKTLRKKRL